MQGCQRCRWSCDEQHFRLVVNVSSTRLWKRQWRSTRQQLMRSGVQDFCFVEGLFTRIRIDYSSSFFLTCNVLPPIFAGFPHRTLQGPLCFIVSFYLDWDLVLLTSTYLLTQTSLLSSYQPIFNLPEARPSKAFQNGMRVCCADHWTSFSCTTRYRL